jgi:hypothetical protein
MLNMPPPEGPAGIDGMVIEVALFTVKLAALPIPTTDTVVVVKPPNSNPVPVSVTEVPPCGEPACGVTPVTVGMGIYV